MGEYEIGKDIEKINIELAKTLNLLEELYNVIGYNLTSGVLKEPKKQAADK